MRIEEALDLATETIIYNGFSDITNESLEIEFIKEFKDKFKDDLKTKLNKGSIYDMEFRPIQYVLTPKNRFVFDYRKAAIIHPACLIKYLTLVLQLAAEVEAARIPVSDNIVFSNRYDPKDNVLFSKDINYSKWKENSAQKIKDSNCCFLVSCDIAAFYDRINIHRIESTLLDIGIDKKLVTKVNNLLLFWSKKDSYGLPVGNDASRILSEVALIDIDEYLVSEGVNFSRYVDDYRFFAPDLITAQQWMNKLATRLFRDGLMLNIGKTRIKEILEATEKHAIEEELGDEAETVLKVITKLSGGYSRIVRRFIMPAEDKHQHFININLEEEINILKNQSIIEFPGIQKIVIASIVQNKYDFLVEIAQICSKYLYGLDYFIDMLIKNSQFIPEELRNQIADFYSKILLKPEYLSFEWHCASIVKLLADKNYFRKKALIELYRTSGKDISTYASMMALQGLQDKITRSEFRTIREYFDRSDEWEKRRLVKLSNALPEDERKAWAKAIKSTVTNDKLCLMYVESIIKGNAI